METKHRLAIVIPAYKIEFFQRAIQSIADQTCKNFTLYIGDDASPYNLEEVAKLFDDKIDIVYKRFDNNLGAENLVAHWSRCINMIQGEEWVWFFSDDDLMDESCVDLFYQHITTNPDHTFLHFNLQIINQHDTPIYKALKFPPHFSTMDFFTKRLNNKIHSCAVEYIFKRDAFEKANGFESFDLAWASDDATWIKLSIYDGIHTIDGAYVRWRQSAFNISPRSDNSTVHRKLNATIDYIKWAERFFKLHNLVDSSSDIEKASYPIRVVAHTKSLNIREKLALITHVAKSLNLTKLQIKMTLFWTLLEIKAKVKHMISYDKRLAKELANAPY